MSNIPKLRFPEFTDAWEKCKLGEVLALLKDGTHGTHKNVEADGVFLLSAKNIKDGKIYIDKNDRKISRQDFLDIHKTFSLQNGDVLLTIVGSIGEAAIIQNVENITFQRSVAYLRPKENLASQFLFTTITTSSFQNELVKRQVTSAQSGVYLGQLEKIEITLPTLPEQQKIGALFRRLDRLITLHKRKWDDVILLKKALLQKMFPKNGSDFPEIRFSEFTDAWEKCKLGEVLALLKDGTHGTHKNVEADGVFLLSAKNIKDGKIYIDKNDRKISRQDFLDIHKTFSLQNGDVLLTIVGSIGEAAIIQNVENITFQRSVAYLRPKENLASQFLFTTITTSSFQNELVKRQVTSAQSGVYLGQLEKIEITLPTLPEQQKIGALFRRLDRLITLHKRQHEHYQLLKKALLQQMFV